MIASSSLTNCEKGKESTKYFPKCEIIIVQLWPTWLSTAKLEMNWAVWVLFQRIQDSFFKDALFLCLILRGIPGFTPAFSFLNVTCPYWRWHSWLGVDGVMKPHYMERGEKPILSSFLMYKIFFLLIEVTFGWECWQHPLRDINQV